jgi:hypothetical protein
MHKVTFVHRPIFLNVLPFSLTEVVLEEATKHVPILVSNLTVAISDSSIGIAYEIGTKVVDELVALLMMRSTEPFLPVLVAAKKMALIGTLKELFPTLGYGGFRLAGLSAYLS